MSATARATTLVLLLAASCGGSALQAGHGRPLPAGRTGTDPGAAPATGLRRAKVLTRGVLAYDAAFAGATAVAIELTTGFALARHTGDNSTTRIPLGPADWDVVDLSVTDDGQQAWLASADGQVRGFALDTGAQVAGWQLGAAATAVAAVTVAGRPMLLTGDATGVLCLRRTDDGALLQCVTAHNAPIAALATTTAGTQPLVASAAQDGTVIVWELPSLRVQVTRTDRGSANAVAFSPEGSRLAIGWSRRPPRRSPSVVMRERATGYSVPDPAARIELWDLADDLIRCAGHGAAVTDLAWTPDGARLLSTSWDRTVRLWDTRTGQQLARLGGFTQLVRSVEISGDGRHVLIAAWAAALDDPAVVLLDLLYPE